ncbi:uncharacterized protein [Paramormyrops kingsleyae]|uniref:uncharacterized protein isoform X3 n=1 Tax=Paramormyrops kingsleyae TaxID=1676925 RepID=UPI003B96B3F4
MQEGQVYRHTRMCLDSEEEDPDWVFEESLLDQDHHVAVGLGKMEQSAGSVAHVHKMVFRRTAVQQTQMTKGGVHSLKSNKQDSVTQGSWAPVFVTEQLKIIDVTPRRWTGNGRRKPPTNTRTPR